MDYTGKKVYHKAKYGKGVITSCDKNGLLKIRFDNEPVTKSFQAPACFQSFLKLEDENAAKIAEAENRVSEKEKQARREQEAQSAQAEYQRQKREREQRAPLGKKRITVPIYSDVNAFCEEQMRILNKEAAFLRKSGGKRQKLQDGRFVGRSSNSYIYSFESDTELSLPDNTQITLWTEKESEGTPASVISCEEFTVIFATSRNFGDSVPSLSYSAETWRLVYTLVDRLKELQDNPSQIVQSLIREGVKKIQYGRPIEKGQKKALKMSLSQPITFIWGPPGTGKTETLARIALSHVEMGHRVLMLSYSNVSVDGAVLRAFQRDDDQRPGKLLRYGYPKNKTLLQHPWLTSYQYVLQENQPLQKERVQLQEERRKVNRSSARYVQIQRRMSQIRDTLRASEKEAVNEAGFVATTVSKAIVDSAVYQAEFDVVIFDEASMAYIPQVIFSAGLAKKHFVCLGDFSQLPPIVQSDSESPLNADIFHYCRIDKAVAENCGHEWLCMLDTQYRMHPSIAAFASRVMYHGLLKSAPGMAESRSSMVNSAPFEGTPLMMVDLSGMMSVCIRTGDQSRINVLSALISMGLASRAAATQEVGLITPYHAQSRLLHAMAHDLEEEEAGFKKISCATVHQFQGSERDVILYDAVDCYRMTYPGLLLSATTNQYANRLFNVAVTRARGKLIAVANVAYLKSKGLAKSLMFRQMIDDSENGGSVSGNKIFDSFGGPNLRYFKPSEGGESFLKDVRDAKTEIRIDVPGQKASEQTVYQNLGEELKLARARGVRVVVRAENLSAVPQPLKPYTLENRFVSDPITLVDKKIVWYGFPPSEASFISEGITIPTKYRPVIRFVGRHFASALYGLLEMSKTTNPKAISDAPEQQEKYDTFASYCSAELKCKACGKPYLLKKSRSGRFFLACSGYPACENTEKVTPELIDSYLYFNNKKGRHCPQDHTSLEGATGKYGSYVRCNNGSKPHYYKLDEI